MLQEQERLELDVIPPLVSITTTLNVALPELELAVATSGVSLCPMMRAIIAAMVVDNTWRETQH